MIESYADYGMNRDSGRQFDRTPEKIVLSAVQFLAPFGDVVKRTSPKDEGFQTSRRGTYLKSYQVMMMVAEKTILEIIQEKSDSLQTPYYLIDESRLLNNLKKIQLVRERSGAKCVLALKCFATWRMFDLMGLYMDGTTSSSLYEARLGYEKFGKEVHVYSVAYSDENILALSKFVTKIIFNSLSQLKKYHQKVKNIPVGLRLNPGISHSHYDLADPARRYSHLGASDLSEIMKVESMLSGVMFHCNCENDDFDSFNKILDQIEKKFGLLLHRMEWVSLGGGISFTKDSYPLDAFCRRLSDFARRFDVQVYLEPGEAAIAYSGFLVTKVLDIVHNEIDIAIVDAGVEPHMLDLLVYRKDAEIDYLTGNKVNGSTYTIAGRTCLAGDIFGTYTFPNKLHIGSLIPFADAAGYTMVKKNWFNGISMPSIVIRRIDGQMDVVKTFNYDDFLTTLS